MIVVFDVDGTLLNIEHRVHLIRPPDGGKKDWVAFRARAIGDKGHRDIMAIYRALHDAQHTLLICSGRMESERNVTTHVLHDVYDLPRPYVMLMRQDKDYRPDYEVKLDMLNKLNEMGLFPDMAVDDRKQVVDMWRSQGVRCLQVAPGEF